MYLRVYRISFLVSIIMVRLTSFPHKFAKFNIKPGPYLSESLLRANATACVRNGLSGIRTVITEASRGPFPSQNGHGGENGGKKTRRKAAMREFAGNNPLLLTAKELRVSIVARSRNDFLFCSYPPSGQMKKRERERGLFCVRSRGINGLGLQFKGSKMPKHPRKI